MLQSIDMSTSHTSRAAGFTLVELLTVIAVVTVLTSILLTVFSRVREKGRSAVCQSRLKQLALAMQQYNQDHEGRYPGANVSKTTPGMPGTHHSQRGLRRFRLTPAALRFSCVLRAMG